ncbi:BTAD domain-containing putative transcriptional regulator [Streptomyces sp. S.PB5]|uniref:BTAD domain-containing putative transcriptional regulator n=1 Tax=Streptomyces sp. S.PB5 TaxID=3020844 RepID=UPI0025B09A2B|nr:BTAD domain-containing putative transcriptional regulator [Streptomyces sp. S.PB5]MDN3024140.1 BTAD domain-containing putative transcriptional regulator [Streptomyces sp. S.PB5]
MRFAVLGSLTAVDDDGVAVVLGGPKPRTLLAALLLEPNRAVPVETVMTVLWGEEPPPTATASLHNHIARLRRSLRDVGGTRLRTRSHGLELLVGEGESDRPEFEAGVRRAQEAGHREDWAAAERFAGAALALWRGTPFADVPALAGHPVVTFLQEQRLQALECRYEALLRLGRLDGLAAELGVLVKEHPFREALHRQLMLVLGRTDRRAEALALFRSLRRTLVEELGVEPGPAVQEAHQEVLRSGAETPPSPQRPAQLPSSPGDFVGRDAHIAEIRGELESAAARTAVAVISGMPGVGKTGLALHVAEQLRPAFPDGQLYLNLHGATPGVRPLSPADALSVLLHGLGVDTRRIPCDVGAASALLRSTLAATRTLLVLDDAASVTQVRPLLPAGAGCAVLLTSRRPLATLGASVHVRLEPLSPQDGALLLERASGRSWTASDAEPVARLVALCGRLPLALRVSAARLRSRRNLPVAKLVERLARPEDRLDHLELEDLSVRRPLLAAHEALLGSGDPCDADAAAALVLVGALDLPEYGTHLMATALNRTERAAERALVRLAEVALLQEVGWDRYTPHDLVRDFARELASRPGEQDRTAAATERALRWYEERLAQCATALRPDPGRTAGLGAGLERGRGAGSGTGTKGGRGVEHGLGRELGRDLDHGRSLEQGRDLGPVQDAGLGRGPEHGRSMELGQGHDDRRSPEFGRDPQHGRALGAGQVSEPGRNLVHGRSPEFGQGHEGKRSPEFGRGPEHSQALGPGQGPEPGRDLRHAQGPAPRPGPELGRVLRSGQNPGGEQQFPRPRGPKQAHHGERPADRPGTVFAGTAAALAWGDEEVANLLHLAGSGADGRLGPARTLALIGSLFPYLHDRGRARDLERLTRHAIALARSSGNTAAEGRALGHLASAHYSAGHLRRALLLLDEAVELSEALSDDTARMRHLGNRAALLRELGRGDDARTTLARCLALRPERLTPVEEAELLGHQGHVAELTDPRSALAYHRRSRDLAREFGSAVIEQVALCNAGRVHLRLGEPARALHSFDEALQVMTACGAHWNAERETRLGRAQALRALGRLEEAEDVCAVLIREAAARGDTYGRGLAEYECGHVRQALGDERSALRRWHGALSALEGTDAQVLGDLRALAAAAG